MLIAIAAYDTDANRRSTCTEKMLDYLVRCDGIGKRHRIFFIDNGSCQFTKRLFRDWYIDHTVITFPRNVGTANAINEAWKHRKPGEHCVKMDNDILLLDTETFDTMDYVLERMAKSALGIVGVKRVDVEERPNAREDFYRTRLDFVWHERGDPWIPLEYAKHVIGSCQAYRSDLLDSMGFLWQPGLYGFDDSLAAFRAARLGYSSAFIPHLRVEHIDPPEPWEYFEEKIKVSGEQLEGYHVILEEYETGARPLYYGGINYDSVEETEKPTTQNYNRLD